MLSPLSDPETPEVEDELLTAPQSPPALARNAGLLAAGNLGSRLLGLVREILIASLFATGTVSAFRVAAQIPNLIYDMLIGGMLSAALVPVLSAQTQRERRALFGVLLGVFGAVLALLALLLFIAAPWLARVLAVGFVDDPVLGPLTVNLIRLMAPAVWLFSIAGLLTAGLYASQRFSIPALGSALFNLGVVIATPLLASRLGIYAAGIGVVLGGVVQATVMAWDVRRAGLSLRPRFNWRHPALRQILRLYLPIALGLLVMLFQVGLDRRLASTTGEESIAWMSFATTLQQLPLGLISVAVALASLPSLSTFFANGEESAFRATLGKGMRYVLLFIVPAAVGLAVLATPVTRLLFQRGEFTPADTEAVVAALHIYLIGMLFAAVDFPLNYAYYARNNTLLPALVGIASVAVYMIVAYALLASRGYLGLVWADTAKQAAHAVIMVVLVWRLLGQSTGNAPGMATVRQVLLVLLSGAAMGLTIWFVDGWFVDGWLGGVAPAGFLGDLLRVVVGGGAGVLVYGAALALLRVNEARAVWRRLRPGV